MNSAASLLALGITRRCSPVPCSRSRTGHPARTIEAAEKVVSCVIEADYEPKFDLQTKPAVDQKFDILREFTENMLRLAAWIRPLKDPYDAVASDLDRCCRVLKRPAA